MNTRESTETIAYLANELRKAHEAANAAVATANQLASRMKDAQDELTALRAELVTLRGLTDVPESPVPTTGD